jgi:hypothetical protein
MAITNLAYPSGSPSVQDSLWHVFDSNITSTDLKYVMDIYVGGTQQVRVKIYPEPLSGIGYFDAGPIVRNTMTYQWLTPKEELLVCEPNVSGQVAQTYQYRIGEESSGVTNLNLASGNVTAYNWTAPVFKRKVSDISVYNGKAFTNRPSTIELNLTDNLYIGAKDVSGVTIATYNANNALITSVNLSLTTLRAFAQLNIGPNALNTSNGSALITSAVKYYLVTIGTSIFRVNLVCNPKYESYNLHFLNHLGVFDTAIFDLSSRLTMDVQRKGFEKRDYTYGATSVNYFDANKKYVDSKVNYLNVKDHSYKLTMNAPTDAEYEWLAELIDSPQVYFELDGYYYPVSIKNNNYEYSKYVNNRLRVFEVDIDINQTRYSQLR